MSKITDFCLMPYLDSVSTNLSFTFCFLYLCIFFSIIISSKCGLTSFHSLSSCCSYAFLVGAYCVARRLTRTPACRLSWPYAHYPHSATLTLTHFTFRAFISLLPPVNAFPSGAACRFPYFDVTKLHSTLLHGTWVTIIHRAGVIISAGARLHGGGRG